MSHQIKNVLVLQFTELPDDIQESIKADHEGFSNDCLLRMISDYSDCLDELSLADLQGWHSDQCVSPVYGVDARPTGAMAFSGTFEEFVVDYGLQLEMWIIKRGFDLSKVDDIVIDVCW